jgi:trigger factor
MNISLNKTDAQSGIIKIKIEKKDYAIQVEKALRQYRQKIDIPGFRKGMVPVGIVQKMYGRYVLAEELDKIVSENLMKYMSECPVSTLGIPVANTTEQEPIDFEKQENFEFCYDIALTPEIHVVLDKEDQLTYYQVEVDEAQIEKQISYHRGSLGATETVECVEVADLVKGIATELENEIPKEGGIVVENAILLPDYIIDKEEQAKFIGAKPNDVIVFNLHKAYKGATTEIASFLNVDRKRAEEGITSDFRFEVTEITRFKEAALDQALFDKLFGEGEVKCEEEFKERIKASLIEQYQPRSDYKLMSDVRALLLEKTSDTVFADSILKCSLLASKQTTPEKLDESYQRTIEDLKYTLAKEFLVTSNGLIVEEDDLIKAAKQMVKAQYLQVGIYIPDHAIGQMAEGLLNSDQKTLMRVMDLAVDEKLLAWIKTQVNVETKNVSIEEFEKLLA